MCPVCNGLSPLAASCPQCGALAEDEGRPEDWTGPYSPYELTPRAMAAADTESTVCPHCVRCPNCRDMFLIEVGIWHL